MYKLSLFSSAFLTAIPLASACDPTPTASDISSPPSALFPTIPAPIAEEDDIEWDNIQLPTFLERIDLEREKVDYTKIHNLVGTSLGRYSLHGKTYVAYDVQGEGNDCLFNTLGLTRQEVKERLTGILSNTQDPKHLPIRYMLACDLWASFVEGRLPPLLQNKFKDLLQQQEEINKKYQNEKQNALWQLVKQRSLKIAICQPYLDNLLAEGSMIAMGGFTRQEGESAEIKRRQFSLMDAIAYAFNIAVEVYREPRLPSSPLLLSQSFIFEGFERFICILSKEIHYVPLIPQEVELTRNTTSSISNKNMLFSQRSNSLQPDIESKALVEMYFSLPLQQQKIFLKDLSECANKDRIAENRLCASQALEEIKERIKNKASIPTAPTAVFNNAGKMKRTRKEEGQMDKSNGNASKRQRLSTMPPPQINLSSAVNNRASTAVANSSSVSFLFNEIPSEMTVPSVSDMNMSLSTSLTPLQVKNFKTWYEKFISLPPSYNPSISKLPQEEIEKNSDVLVKKYFSLPSQEQQLYLKNIMDPFIKDKFTAGLAYRKIIEINSDALVEHYFSLSGEEQQSFYTKFFTDTYNSHTSEEEDLAKQVISKISNFLMK